MLRDDFFYHLSYQKGYLSQQKYTDKGMEYNFKKEEEQQNFIERSIYGV